MDAVPMPSSSVGAETMCILIADDLTGACDSGLEFARHQLVTRVGFGRVPAGASDVAVVSTNSRRLQPLESAALMHFVAQTFPSRSPNILFKKIDSTLRGHVIAECDALRDAAFAPFGVIAPALPAQGRVVKNGVLEVNDISGRWSLDIRELLAAQGAFPVLITPRGWRDPEDLAKQMEQAAADSRYVLCDAEEECDLGFIAEALIACKSRPIWIGSAGLAKYAAAFLRRADSVSQPRRKAPSAAPVILCVGSHHPVTNLQVNYFRSCYSPYVFEATSAITGEICSALDSGSHLILLINTQTADTGRLQELLVAARTRDPAAILVTGGDTAELVCSAVKTEQLLLEGELVSGIAAGHIEGGLLDGMIFATKSGGFGTESCLVESVKALSTAGGPKL
jgi:D-threonate/D-erythronate kinase